MQDTTQQKGISLVEIIIVIAVIVLLARIVGLPFLKFRQQQALENTTNAVVAILNEARTKTLAGYNNAVYSVRVQNDRIILFSGATYNSSDTTNQTTLYETSITGSWNLQPTPGTTDTITFVRLKGTTTNSGTITLSISGGASHTVSISSLGTITRN